MDITLSSYKILHNLVCMYYNLAVIMASIHNFEKIGDLKLCIKWFYRFKYIRKSSKICS
ncbi:MAG: hypothetical protein K0R14_1232 [Burkholderiales bacterium]|jgi:hypothetical protein|nr:hypothetical protein [Burkholderiales bacterium]